MKRAEAQRLGNGSVPQGKGSGNTAPSVPVQRGHASSGRGCAPAHPLRQPVSPGNPDTRPVQKSGKTIVKTARSARKVPERTARHAIKTAERSSRKAIKTTQRTAKTAQQTVKTAQRSAQATVKATQRAVQTARATAKAAAVTAKATAKATVAAIKAAIAAMQELIAAIAAGGWVVIVVVLVICMIGLLIASPFGIFFSDGGGSPDAASPTAVIAQINSEYADRLSALQTGGTYDRVEIQGGPPSWPDVFAVFAAKTAGGADGAQVSVLDTDTVEKLRTVFWDMTKITTEVETVSHPASGSTLAWSETVLKITSTPRTPDDMRVFYSFTDGQNQALDSLLANGGMLASLAGDLTISRQDAKALLAALPTDLDPERRAVVETACRLVGKVNYFWGGKSRVIGWDERWGQIKKVTASGSSTSGTYRPFGLDCSGFVDWVFYNMTGGSYIIGHGGGAHSQHGYCTAITWDQATPGDLVFYPGDTHVGIVGGRDENGELLIIHCTYSKNNVVITDKSGFTSIARPNYYNE